MWASAGSPTAPSSSEQTVMPSWLTPMTSEMFSMPSRAYFALRDPASARGSIWLRRAEIMRELGGDEEGVAEHQQQGDQQGDGTAHDPPSSSSAGTSCSRRLSRSTRSPSMCSTVSAASS